MQNYPAPARWKSTDPSRTLDVPVSAAQGMLFAFDSLYLSINGGPGSGLYRLRDTDGDDQFDDVKKLRDFEGEVNTAACFKAFTGWQVDLRALRKSYIASIRYRSNEG